LWNLGLEGGESLDKEHIGRFCSSNKVSESSQVVVKAIAEAFKQRRGEGG
jgi:hypothetical protein